MEELKKKIAKFLAVGFGDGFGSGFGSGYGDGFGDGFGSGYGAGYGDDSGDGDGYGYGDDSGDGYGDGFGSGYGSGYGAGYGDDSGDGYGDSDDSSFGDSDIKEFCGHTVHYIDNMPTIIYSVKGNIAKGAILRIDFTIYDCYIAKVDNCFAHGKTAHKAFADAQAKALQNAPLETRIKRFVTQYPNYDTRVPAKELFVWHNALTGSCELGRLEFAKTHNINLETDKFTVREFVELTKNDYGGVNIKLLEKAYTNGRN